MTKEDLEEEIEAIEAIYPGALQQKGSIYQLDVPDLNISIQLSFPSSYPTEPPHILSVLQGPDKSLIDSIIQNIFIPEQVCLFDLIESIRETFEDIQNEDSFEEEEETKENVSSIGVKLSKEDLAKEIFSHWVAGSSIVDRKSVFIGFACKVKSAQEVEDMLINVWDVCVCVSRWYGGIHLGPDRFKHINSAARDVLVQGGFITEDNKKKSKR